MSRLTQIEFYLLHIKIVLDITVVQILNTEMLPACLSGGQMMSSSGLLSRICLIDMMESWVIVEEAGNILLCDSTLFKIHVLQVLTSGNVFTDGQS